MDKREFIKALMAGGALSATSLPSWAASSLRAADSGGAVIVVGQNNLPYAEELVGGIARMLMAAGIRYQQVSAGTDELSGVSGVAAILDRAPHSRLVGVMDDAAALIFQTLAASRGAAYVIQTHHRFLDREVRHCATSSAFDESRVWSDFSGAHAARIGRLYAESIGGRHLADGAEYALPATTGEGRSGTPVSLVSFLINT